MMDMRSLYDVFRSLVDPRDRRGRRYPLMDVPVLALFGMLCGESDFANMDKYLKRREAELTRAFRLARGVPSHDVFSDVFARISHGHFEHLFVRWMEGLLSRLEGRHVAIDGKAVRAAAEKAAASRRGKGKARPPYMASALVCGLGLVIGQVRVGAKTNETTAIPELMALVDLAGATISIDAIGTQTRIMDDAAKRGVHTCLQLKKNHREALHWPLRNTCRHLRLDVLRTGSFGTGADGE